MAVTIEQFRKDYPEFADVAAYPDDGLTYWLAVAVIMINKSRWKTAYDLGVALFLAHHLVLERQALLAAQKGGVPGTQIGILNSKSVDKVSAGYDVSAAAALPDAGHWSMTTYGLRFIQLARMMGAGPVQVGVGYGCFGAQAWQGIWCYNFPNPSG